MGKKVKKLKIKSSILFFVVLGLNTVVLGQNVFVCGDIQLNLDSMIVNQCSNDQKEGVWVNKRNSGELHSIITYRAGIKNGLFISFYRSGYTKVIGCYKEDKKHGLFTRYPWRWRRFEKIINYTNDTIVSVDKVKYPVFPPNLLYKKKCPCFN